MNTQTIFKTGNSSVVAIPRHILKDLGLKTGQKVTVVQTDDGVVIKKVKRGVNPVTKTVKSKANKDFQEWYEVFIKENGEILDELSVR